MNAMEDLILRQAEVQHEGGSGWNLDSATGREKRKSVFSGGVRIMLKRLVDLVGIEPTTSSMPWKRAPSCATGPRERTSFIVLYGV